MVTAAAAALLLCICSVARADLPDVQARGVLRVIVAADEAPETFALEPRADAGFERELIEGFARLRGLRVVPVVAPGYADRIPMLERGEGDVVVAIFDTPDRRKLVDFTAEVMPTHNVVVTMEPRPEVRSLDELRQARVGVIKGAKPAEEAVQAGVPPAVLQAFDKREQLLSALQEGTVSAAILPVSEMVVSARQYRALRARASPWARRARWPRPCARATAPWRPRSTSTWPTCAAAPPGAASS
jgi:ABC-type amino acid transport substrate-binding protein